VVTTIFELRVGERLGYRAIAERLDDALDRNSPPTPVDPARAVRHWTHSSVRGVLTHTVAPKIRNHGRSYITSADAVRPIWS
jgi:site-specific DNA recombinase